MASTLYCPRCLNTFTEDSDNCPNLTCGKKRPKAGWGVLLGPGDLLDRHYRITRALAVGGAGLTYLAREVDQNGTAQPPDLAIKVLYAARASGPFLRRLANEAQILQELDHDYIVKCRGFVHRTGHEPYLVTLFEEGGSLSEHIETVGPVPPRVAAHMVRQILLALDVAHQRGVVHRDLKPDNVLIRQKVDRDEVPHLRLTDFGIAKMDGGLTKLTKVGTFVGTPEYAAPEQFESQPPTPATDIWAAGGVLWYVLTGQPPVEFTHRADIETSYDELLNQTPPALPKTGRPDWDALQDCINHMMVADQENRWTIHQILARLGPLTGTSTEPLSSTPIGMPNREYRKRNTLELTDQGHQPPETRQEEIPKIARTPPPTRDPVEPSAKPAPETMDLDAPSDAEREAILAEYEDPEPSEEETPRRGWLGLGLAGMGVQLLLGSGLVVVVLAGAAFGFGWFTPPSPEPITLDPITVAVGPATDWTTTPTGADFKALKTLRAALSPVAIDAAKQCKARGVVALEVELSKEGTITEATVSNGYQSTKKARCVQQALAGKAVSKPPQKVRFRAAVHAG